MNLFVDFTSQINDTPDEPARDKELIPAGRIHAELIYNELNTWLQKPCPPWNEEDYAWQFIGTLDRVALGFLVGTNYNVDPIEDQFRVSIYSFSFLAWCFPRRARAAVTAACDKIAFFLKSDSRFSNVRIVTLEEDDQMTAALRKKIAVKRRG